MIEGAAAPRQSAPGKFRSRMLGGILWTTSGAGVQIILRVILMLMLARLIGPEAFGVVGAAVVILTVALVLGQLGLGVALVQRAELETSHIRTAFTLALGWGAALTCAIELIAPAVAAFFGFDGLTDLLRVIAFIPLLNNASLVAEALLQRALAFRKLTIVSVVTFLLSFGIVGLGLAAMGGGVWALAAAYLTEAAFRAVILIAIQPHSKKILLDRAALQDLMAIGGACTTWRLAQATAQSIDNVVVGRWLGAEALGLYGRAYQITSMPNALLGRVLSVVMFPVLSRLQQDLPRLASAYRQTLSVVAVVTLPVVAGVVVLAPELVTVLLGPAWEGLILPLQILAPGIFLRIGFQLNIAAVMAAGVIYPAAWRQSLYALAVFTGALIGQQWRLPGVAGGVLCAMLFHFLIDSHLSIQTTTLRLVDFASAHQRGLLLGLLVGIELAILAVPLRTADAAPIFILGVCALALSVTMIIVVRFLPDMLIGPDALWLLRSMINRLPPRFAGLVRFLDLPDAAGHRNMILK